MHLAESLPQPPFGPSTTTSAHHLADLRRAHTILVVAIRELEDLTWEASVDKAHCANLRWRLSKASLARRSICNLILMDLVTRVNAADAAALRDLQQEDLTLLNRSAAHIARWTAETIAEDWKGYCQAARAILSGMVTRIAVEKRVLYPMLQNYRTKGRGTP